MENISPAAINSSDDNNNHGDEAGATDAQWRAKFIQESPHLYCFILCECMCSGEESVIMHLTFIRLIYDYLFANHMY